LRIDVFPAVVAPAGDGPYHVAVVADLDVKHSEPAAEQAGAFPFARRDFD
jgi:hypothetical protein